MDSVLMGIQDRWPVKSLLEVEMVYNVYGTNNPEILTGMTTPIISTATGVMTSFTVSAATTH